MIPFAVTSSDGRSTSLNAQRTINMFAEKAGPGSKAEIILRSTPGLSTFSDAGAGAVRGLHKMNISNAETLFAVIGTDLYEIDSNGAGTLRGSAGTITGAGFVHMASNAIDELMIANSSGTAWLWDNSTLATVVSHDADFTDDATSLTFLDQYIIFTKANTGQVHAFDLNTGKSYNPLSFATAEASPDNAVQAYGFAGNLWIFGEHTTEVFYNAATIPFAFARIGGVVFEDIGGVLNTVADIDNALHFLASDGIIYAATQFQPQRISTHDIENRIRGWTNHYAFTYKDEGHAFYVLGSDSGCVVFDRTTGFWHERESFTVGRWRANSYANVYGKHIVGDYLIGRLYEMSLANHEDGVNALQRRVISPPLYRNGAYMSVPWLQVNFEHGLGLSTSTLLTPTDFRVLSAAGSNLVAPDSENLLTYSEQLDNAAWTKTNSTVSADAATAPDGTVTADKFIPDNAQTSCWVMVENTAEPSLSANTQYALSVVADAAELTEVRVNFWTPETGDNFAVFNLSTGVVSSTFGVDDSGIVDLGNGLYRCWIADTTGATIASMAIQIIRLASGTGDGTSGLYGWGAQMEAASEPGPYHKTEASTVTWTSGLTFISRPPDGVTIKTGGWMPNKTGLLLPGDTVQLEIDSAWETYTVATQADSDYLGQSTFTIVENLIEADQGSDPQVILDWSDDGGMTYGNEHWASIGKIGEYRKRAVWRRTGRFKERVYRLTFTDPVPFTIYGASL